MRPYWFIPSVFLEEYCELPGSFIVIYVMYWVTQSRTRWMRLSSNRSTFVLATVDPENSYYLEIFLNFYFSSIKKSFWGLLLALIILPNGILGVTAERSYPPPEARGGGREEQPHVQGSVAARAQEGQEELLHIQGQEGRLWGDTPRPR